MATECTGLIKGPFNFHFHWNSKFKGHCFAEILLMAIRLLQLLAQDTLAQLSCQVQNFGEIQLQKYCGIHSLLSHVSQINSLAPGRCGSDLKVYIFKLSLWIWLLGNSYEIALWGMPRNSTDDRSTLDQVTAWWVMSGNKPLTKPMLTQIFVAIW